jgi:N-glycosylase/DNA lyase
LNSTDRLDVAVAAICEDLLARSNREVCWRDLDEEVLFREVVACILGSRVSFEMALAATERLAEEGLLQFCGDNDAYRKRVEDALSRPLFHPAWIRPRRYRFPRLRSKAVASTAAAFYGERGSIKAWLARCPDASSARRGMIAKASGVGPKQASMILRNISFCDTLAVLDAHVIRFMNLRRIGERLPRVSTLHDYERAESTLLDYARTCGWPMAVLDQAVWVVMRVYSGHSS